MKRETATESFALILLLIFSLSLSGLSRAAISEKAREGEVPGVHGELPLYFIENRGQIDPRVRFYVKTPGQTLYFTGEGIVFDLLRRQGKGVKAGTAVAETERLVFELRFENSRKGAVVDGLYPRPARVNYLKGRDRGAWRSGIPTYGGIVYRGIYKGMDLRIYGNNGAIEYEFVISPGGNPADILLTYRGVEGLGIDEEGALLVKTGFGTLRETRPFIYQGTGVKTEVPGTFEIRRSHCRPAGREQYSYGFRVASYDTSRALIIDPTLSFSTYLGGTNWDAAAGVALNSTGNIYVVGTTSSSDFPTHLPYQGTFAGDWDAFITKLSSSGDALVYSTYLGGGGHDNGNGIAVDGAGNAYITGSTPSTDFPLQNPLQKFLAGSDDAFIAKLSPEGSLIFSTYLGGKDEDGGSAIAVDRAGNAYVTGYTKSDDFPHTDGAFQGVYGGGTDAFAARVNTSAGALYYSTYLGGAAEDAGTGIAVDEGGRAYVTGYTESDKFPHTDGAFQETFGGVIDAFVTKFSSSGGALVYSTYLGGTDAEHGYGIAVDGSGKAYVTGETYSTDFPITKNAYQAANGGDYDLFVTCLTSSGGDLSYSTYLGGTDEDAGYGIALNGSGDVYVAGLTDSMNFPTKDPYQGAFNGDEDAVVVKFSPGAGEAGDTLVYSTYLGGEGSDWGSGIALDPSGNAIVAGTTQSDHFPTQNPYQPDRKGSADAFITRLSEAPPDLLYVSKTPGCGGKSPCYSSIAGAVSDAGSTATILVTGDTYQESILLEDPKTLRLKGGWDSSFASQTSHTTADSMTVKNGTFVVEGLMVR